MLFPSLCDGKFPEELGLKIAKQYKTQGHGWVLAIGFFYILSENMAVLFDFFLRQNNYSKTIKQAKAEYSRLLNPKNKNLLI